MSPALLDEVAAETRCAWCGVALDHRNARGGRISCRTCGVATTYPWPDDATLARAYGSWYRPPTGRFSGAGDALLRRLRGRLARRLDALAPPGPVLDVGAGDGALVDALRARGRPATGLERSPARSDLARQEVTEHEGEYAAVVFWHSIEHLRRPADALDRAAELLLPGGLLVASTPNAASLQARAFGDRWFALDLPRHLVHLTAEALVARVAAAGFEIECISHWRGGQVVFGWLHGLVGALPGSPDLYDAIRRPPARRTPLGPGRRAAALAAAAALLPVAAALAAAEVAARRGGTVYVEARRHGPPAP